MGEGAAPSRLSHRLTPAVKAWGVFLLGIAAVSVVIHSAWVLELFGVQFLTLNQVSTALVLFVSAPLTVLVAMQGWNLARLKGVSVSPGELRLNEILGECAVRCCDIEGVRTNRWLSVNLLPTPAPVVTITLKKPCRFGRKVRFLARGTKIGWVNDVHPDVIMLRRMAEAAGRDGAGESDVAASDQEVPQV